MSKKKKKEDVEAIGDAARKHEPSKMGAPA